MIKQWRDAPEWATHIVAPTRSPDIEMWAQLIEGKYYNGKHRQTRAVALVITGDFDDGMMVVSERPTATTVEYRIANPVTLKVAKPVPVEKPVRATRRKREPGAPKLAKAVVVKREIKPLADGTDYVAAKLTGAALNWAVAQASGLRPSKDAHGDFVCDYPWRGQTGKPIPDFQAEYGRAWRFVSLYGLNINSPVPGEAIWAVWMSDGQRDIVGHGNTPQEAICRCVVMHLIGQRLTVPPELVELT